MVAKYRRGELYIVGYVSGEGEVDLPEWVGAGRMWNTIDLESGEAIDSGIDKTFGKALCGRGILVK